MAIVKTLTILKYPKLFPFGIRAVEGLPFGSCGLFGSYPQMGGILFTTLNLFNIIYVMGTNTVHRISWRI